MLGQARGGPSHGLGFGIALARRDDCIARDDPFIAAGQNDKVVRRDHVPEFVEVSDDEVEFYGAVVGRRPIYFFDTEIGIVTCSAHPDAVRVLGRRGQAKAILEKSRYFGVSVVIVPAGKGVGFRFFRAAEVFRDDASYLRP